MYILKICTLMQLSENLRIKQNAYHTNCSENNDHKHVSQNPTEKLQTLLTK